MCKIKGIIMYVTDKYVIQSYYNLMMEESYDLFNIVTTIVRKVFPQNNVPLLILLIGYIRWLVLFIHIYSLQVTA